jgi:hypothetical protein
VTGVQSRTRWRNSDINTDGVEEYKIDIPAPQIVHEYFKFNGEIDSHNRKRQHDVNIEKKLQVKEWHRRAISSIIGMVAVDAFLMYKGSRVKETEAMNIKDFIRLMAGEMITNKLDHIGISSSSLRKKRGAAVVIQDGLPALPLKLAPPRPIACPDKGKDKDKQRAFRAACEVCKDKTSFICSHCIKRTFVCQDGEWKCFMSHLKDEHIDHYEKL